MKLSRFTLRALQIGGTTAVFALTSHIAALFSFPSGVSFLFPPAGVSLAAGAAFGPWGVAGVVLEGGWMPQAAEMPAVKEEDPPVAPLISPASPPAPSPLRSV